MEQAQVATLSTTGRAVIPQRLRERLGLRAGDDFVVVGGADTVAFKRPAVPPQRALEQVVRDAGALAKRRMLTKQDLERSGDVRILRPAQFLGELQPS